MLVFHPCEQLLNPSWVFLFGTNCLVILLYRRVMEREDGIPDEHIRLICGHDKIETTMGYGRAAG